MIRPLHSTTGATRRIRASWAGGGIWTRPPASTLFPMHAGRRIRQALDRRPSIGAFMWLSSVQFFVAQVVVASSWSRPPYSWRLHAISDLGATGCGPFDDRFVCSPLHSVMNGSLVLLGLTMTTGSMLLYVNLRRSKVGFGLMSVAGIGALLVGLFPEDSIFWVHVVGQDLAFVFGNIALLVFGLAPPFSRAFRWYSVVSGAVGLVGLALFLSHHRFFLELGGMERVVAYPLLLWLTVAGGYLVAKRVRGVA